MRLFTIVSAAVLVATSPNLAAASSSSSTPTQRPPSILPPQVVPPLRSLAWHAVCTKCPLSLITRRHGLPPVSMIDDFYSFVGTIAMLMVAAMRQGWTEPARSACNGMWHPMSRLLGGQWTEPNAVLRQLLALPATLHNSVSRSTQGALWIDSGATIGEVFAKACPIELLALYGGPGGAVLSPTLRMIIQLAYYTLAINNHGHLLYDDIRQHDGPDGKLLALSRILHNWMARASEWSSDPTLTYPLAFHFVEVIRSKLMLGMADEEFARRLLDKPASCIADVPLHIRRRYAQPLAPTMASRSIFSGDGCKSAFDNIISSLFEKPTSSRFSLWHTSLSLVSETLSMENLTQNVFSYARINNDELLRGAIWKAPQLRPFLESTLTTTVNQFKGSLGNGGDDRARFRMQSFQAAGIIADSPAYQWSDFDLHDVHAVSEAIVLTIDVTSDTKMPWRQFLCQNRHLFMGRFVLTDKGPVMEASTQIDTGDEGVVARWCDLGANFPSSLAKQTRTIANDNPARQRVPDEICAELPKWQLRSIVATPQHSVRAREKVATFVVANHVYTLVIMPFASPINDSPSSSHSAASSSSATSSASDMEIDEGGRVEEEVGKVVNCAKQSVWKWQVTAANNGMGTETLRLVALDEHLCLLRSFTTRDVLIFDGPTQVPHYIAVLQNIGMDYKAVVDDLARHVPNVIDGSDSDRWIVQLDALAHSPHVALLFRLGRCI